MSIQQKSNPTSRSNGMRFAALIPLAFAACAVGTEPEPVPSSDVVHADVSSAGTVQTRPTALERYKERIRNHPYAELRGIVTTSDGHAIPSVKVRIGAHEAVTDEAGEYVVEGVEVGSYAVSFEHEGYVFAQRRVALEQPEPGWLAQQLMPRSKSERMNVDEFAVLHHGPLTLEFEPGDLETERDHGEVHGEVEAIVTVIDPRRMDDILAAPAELEGITVNGEQVGLLSYGMIEVELFQNGRKVNVRRGQTVKATMDVTMGTGALHEGDRIPMWHHDTKQGIWVQEPGTDALVQEQDGVRVATAELPHFSAWNWDSVADGVCAPFVVPANMNVARVRVISTNADGYLMTNVPGQIPQHWSISFDCAQSSGRSSRCAVNVPAGSWGSEIVYFKIQAQAAGSATWCDLNIALNGATKVVWTRKDVNDYLTNNGLTNNGQIEGSWCGNQNPSGGWLGQDFTFSLGAYSLPATRITFGEPVSSPNCPSMVGSNAVGANDPGFAALSANAASAAYRYDYDRDGILDKSDKCVGVKSTNQTDGDGDGIGNLCEAICYVPASDPNASWYDYDHDGIDDYCDINWQQYNPSQY